MTDNDVIKGLKCFSGEVIFCVDCAYFKRYRLPVCRQRAAIDALDLIESKDAEIEMYKNLYEDLKAENIETIKAIKKCKAKAIREFAERLKEQLKEECSPRVYMYLGDLVDNLVKEMTEDRK